MFLRNYWYVAATDAEISRKPLGRMILGDPIVLFRAEDGTPVAFEDRCPHRHLPLSMGKLVGDTLQCLYHGLRFATRRPLRLHPRAGTNSSRSEGKMLSGGRTLSLDLDLDGRPGARRSRCDHGFPLA